jgi:hypothetical protein
MIAVAIIGVTVFSVTELWQRTAPSLEELRDSNADSGMATKLYDADIVVGIVVILAGSFLWVVLHDPTALIFLLLTYLALAGYYHKVLGSPAPTN